MKLEHDEDPKEYEEENKREAEMKKLQKISRFEEANECVLLDVTDKMRDQTQEPSVCSGSSSEKMPKAFTPMTKDKTTKAEASLTKQKRQRTDEKANEIARRRARSGSKRRWKNRMNGADATEPAENWEREASPRRHKR